MAYLGFQKPKPKKMNLSDDTRAMLLDEKLLDRGSKKLIGKGSFGVAYQAIYDGKPCVMKEPVLDNNRDLANFEKEARFLHKVCNCLHNTLHR